MKKQLVLVKDKVTKNTIRYAEVKDRWPLQIYLQQSEVLQPNGAFAEKIYVVISTEVLP